MARTGYGDDGQYGTTAAPPMDKDFYLRQLTSMKDLGYNFIRFHTHSMPTELFEAADELGFLCDPEFAMNCASTHSALASLASFSGDPDQQGIAGGIRI